MTVDMKGKDFICINDFSTEEIMEILETARQLKLEEKRSQRHDLLKGKNLAMIFQKPSLRTRVAFEAGINRLGGSAMYLGPGDIKLGERERVADIARVLSRYVDIIMARVFDHQHVVRLAEYAGVPVINGLSDFCHPTQVIADLLTILEKKGRLEGVRVAFIGDGNNVAVSLMYAASKIGLDLTLATPPEYSPDPDLLRELRPEAEHRGGGLSVVSDPESAAREQDVIYTDVWTSMGQEAEYEERVEAFQGYQVTEELVENAASEAIILHCMPINYGEEITEEVVSAPGGQVIYDQAENRMHAHMAIMALLA